jgi:hypothetical protein
VGDPPTILIVVAAATGVFLIAIWLRRRRPGDPETEIQQSILEAERDRQKTEALETVERAHHQWPPGGS